MDANQVAVERADFLAALGSITPASHRSAVTHARCSVASQWIVVTSQDAAKVCKRAAPAGGRQTGRADFLAALSSIPSHVTLLSSHPRQVPARSFACQALSLPISADSCCDDPREGHACITQLLPTQVRGCSAARPGMCLPGWL